MSNILVIDDELSIRESFSLILNGKYNVLLAATGEAALKIASDQKVDLAFLDIRMPGMNGLEALKKLKALDPSIEVIMVTAVNDVQKASEAINEGARDYVVKPFDVDFILKLAEQTIRRKNILSERMGQPSQETPELAGQTESISSLARAIEKIKDNTRILIIGEPGTEKETVARIIHAKSDRAQKPLDALHLYAGVSPKKLKAKLVGWGKGTNTLELSAQSGIFEQNREGTLFLDNIEFLPHEIFKIIAGGQATREGSPVSIPITTRLIAGASPGTAEVSKEVFDFFSDYQLSIPPLRERSSDIPILVSRLTEKFSRLYGRELKLSHGALDVLTNYAWPGNLRQLENLIERLTLTAKENLISAEMLPFDLLMPHAQGTENAGRTFLEDFKNQYIHAALAKCGKDKEKAAKLLGVSPRAL